MKPTDLLRCSAVWLRLPIPAAALLATLLQRAPAARLAAAAESFVHTSPLGAVLRAAFATTASLGALHTLAGATNFVSSMPGPLSARVGSPLPTVAFTVTDTINIASWRIGGTLPPGVTVNAREGGPALSAPGILQAPVSGTIFDPSDPYAVPGNSVPTTTPFLAGTPTQAGTYSLSFQAYQSTAATGLASRLFTFEIVVAPGTTQPANVAPSISTQPQTQSVLTGGNVTFTVAASGTPAPAIQWRKDGVDIPGATAATLTLTNVQSANAGSYSATVTNAAGNVTTTVAALTVLPPATTAVVPAIAAAGQPAAQTIAAGSTVVFNVAATGAPAPTYQWRKDGAALANATSATLILNAATATQAGVYSVVVSNSVGSTTSTAAALTVTSVPAPSVGRLANLSILTTAGSGAKALTIGATVGGSGTSGSLPLVIRAVGPTLGQAPFGIAGVLADPVLSLNRAGEAAPFATNDDWGNSAALATAFANVGAFSLQPNSLDAAIVPAGPGLASGGYTVQVAGKGSATGTVIAEMYDASGNARGDTTPRLTNLSTLTDIAAGSNLAVGFVIGGASARTLLVRGVGPTLGSAFGLGGTMADPKLELFNNATGQKISENDNWGGDAALATAQASVGAFALANATSKDAVLLITLAPGQSSARVSAADGAGGTAIVEVYEVP
ncbi:MAG: immunoglobulin domain-containing protein [Verrucomicrobia bacterium]|nr:immunoglobulin domain-containing protein [Verrucomicrobiota bacterium]